jgi:hypothetical protein
VKQLLGVVLQALGRRVQDIGNLVHPRHHLNPVAQQPNKLYAYAVDRWLEQRMRAAARKVRAYDLSPKDAESDLLWRD